MRVLEEFLRPTQAELFKMIRKMYKGMVYVCEQNFLLVRGKAPIMLVAHLDTVHSEPVKEICKSKDKNILMSPQGIGGDDRCGVYALVKIHELAQVKPWLLFTCDEEAGGVGAENFCKAYAKGKLPAELSALKFVVEVDRRGSNDAVYYDCDSHDFETYITDKGFVTACGSFSDISLIAPALYNAHTPHEYIVRSELECTIEKIIGMVADAAKIDFPKYAYAKRKCEVIDKRYASYFYDRQKIYGFGKNALPVCLTSENRLHDEFCDTGTRKRLPSEYEEIYDELLEMYSAEELEKFRELYGDQILYEIYIDEYGPFFAEQDREVI